MKTGRPELSEGKRFLPGYESNSSGIPFDSRNPTSPFSSLGTLQIWETRSKLSHTRGGGGGEGANHLKTKEKTKS